VHNAQILVTLARRSGLSSCRAPTCSHWVHFRRQSDPHLRPRRSPSGPSQRGRFALKMCCWP